MGAIIEAMVRVKIHVTLKPSLLDSAGRTVAHSLNKMGFDEIADARIGKTIELSMEQYDSARVEEMCRKLLSNPVIEDFKIEAPTQ